MKINEIVVKKEYSPRLVLDDNIITRYKELYELDQRLPPLVVQKEKRILIDGFHRLSALKQLERETVEVELMDISEEEIFPTSIRLNKQHGLPPSKRDRNHQIRRLRFDTEPAWSYEKIGNLVELSTTQVGAVCREWEMKLRIIGSDKAKKKVDKRKKIEKSEVLKRLRSGQKKSIVARDLGVSPSRVTQISKNFKATDDDPIIIVCHPKLFEFMLRATLGNETIEKATINFTEEGLMATQYEYGEEDVGVFAFFAKDYFEHYDVKEELVWEVKSETIKQVDVLGKRGRADFIQFSFDGDGITLIGEAGGKFQLRSLSVGTRPEPMIFEKIDSRGIPNSIPILFHIGAEHFGGMPEVEKIDLELKNNTFSIRGETKHKWIFNKHITDIEIERAGNCTCSFNAPIIKKLFLLQNRMPRGFMSSWGPYKQINVGISVSSNNRATLLINHHMDRFFVSYLLLNKFERSCAREVQTDRL